LGEFFADGHQTGHLGLGDLDFLAAPGGKAQVGDVEVSEVLGFEHSVQGISPLRWNPPGNRPVVCCLKPPPTAPFEGVSAVETCPSLERINAVSQRSSEAGDYIDAAAPVQPSRACGAGGCARLDACLPNACVRCKGCAHPRCARCAACSPTSTTRSRGMAPSSPRPCRRCKLCTVRSC